MWCGLRKRSTPADGPATEKSRRKDTADQASRANLRLVPGRLKTCAPHSAHSTTASPASRDALVPISGTSWASEGRDQARGQIPRIHPDSPVIEA